MIGNYLRTALRSLIRHRTYSLINIFGLSIGLTSCILIFLWITDEMEYDRFYPNADAIYRIQANYIFPNGSIETYSASTYSLADAARHEIPEIQTITRAVWPEHTLVKRGERSFEENGFYADSNFFSVLQFPLVAGNSRRPLADAKSIVLTERLASKLFNGEDAIGQVVQLNQRYDLTVSAVVRDIPGNSTIQFDWICSLELWAHENPWCANWHSGAIQTYVTLVPGTAEEIVNSKLLGLTKRNCTDCINQPFLYKLSDLHLHGMFIGGKVAGGKIEQVQLLGLVAVIILVIACINFMNLATARSATRSREVGVRKSIGALPSALIFQFVLEALFLAFIALLMALVFVQLLLPTFNEITDKHIRIEFTDGIFLTGTCCITLMCGLLAGSYPALFLSSIRPALVLKGSFQAPASGGRLRSGLVVAQFVTSVILIVFSVVVYDQMAFIRRKDLGFDKNNVISINLHSDLARNSLAFKLELLRNPAVTSVAFGGSNVFQIPIATREPKWPTKQESQSVSFKVYRCDQDFIPLMRMKLLAGRNFSDLNSQDASNYIVNRMAVEAMGLTIETAVGSEFEMWNGKGTIVGVTENFNTGNLHEAIEPLIFMYSQHSGQYYFIRTNGSREALTHIEGVVRKFDPDYPFQYSFLTDTYAREYRTESTVGELALFFTTVAILISCLGLFGLSLFTAERRVKELGVRKILGASTAKLVAMLCADFAKLVVFALIVGLPCAYFLSRVYLDGYVFHTGLTVWTFAVPAAGLITLALLTISYQSYSAAVRNPAESLRNE